MRGSGSFLTTIRAGRGAAAPTGGAGFPVSAGHDRQCLTHHEAEGHRDEDQNAKVFCHSGPYFTEASRQWEIADGGVPPALEIVK